LSFRQDRWGRSGVSLAAAASRLSAGLGLCGTGKELLPAVLAAEVGRIAIAFGMESGGWVHGHAADGIDCFGGGFIHGFVSFFVCCWCKLTISFKVPASITTDHRAETGFSVAGLDLFDAFILSAVTTRLIWGFPYLEPVPELTFF